MIIEGIISIILEIKVITEDNSKQQIFIFSEGSKLINKLIIIVLYKSFNIIIKNVTPTGKI